MKKVGESGEKGRGPHRRNRPIFYQSSLSSFPVYVRSKAEIGCSVSSSIFFGVIHG